MHPIVVALATIPDGENKSLLLKTQYILEIRSKDSRVELNQMTSHWELAFMVSKGVM